MTCTMGQTPDLHTTENWESCLVDQMVGLHQEENCLQVKEGDPSSLLSFGEAHLECWIQCWAPQCKRDLDLQKRVQERTAKMSK